MQTHKKRESSDPLENSIGCFVTSPPVPKTFINYPLIDWFKREEPDIYNSLHLSKIQSVGDDESPLLYMPASLEPKLYRPKLAKFSFRDRDINEDDWTLSLFYLRRHFSFLNQKVAPLNFHDLRPSLLVSLSDNKTNGSPGPAFKTISTSKYDFVLRCFHKYVDIRKEIFRGLNPVAIWRIFLKEELRPFKKWEENSTRIIFGSPVSLFCAEFELFKNLQDLFIDNRHRFWSSAGLDFSGSEYGRVFKHFVGHDIISVDGSNFDGSQQVFDLWDLQNLWYSFLDVDDTYLPLHQYVLSNTVFSLCLCPDGELIVKECGNPTGSYLTLMRNSWHCYRLFAYVFISHCRSIGEKPTYNRFNSHLALINGDDCIITSSRFINKATITSHMSKFLDLTFDNGTSIFNSSYCGCRAADYEGTIVPLRDSRKLILSLIMLENGHFQERISGILNANPFDDIFCSLLRKLSDHWNFDFPDLVAIRRRFVN